MMGATVLVVLMLSGLSALLWAVVSVAGWPHGLDPALEEPEPEARRVSPRSLTMPARRSLNMQAPPKPEPEAAAEPDEVARADAILARMAEPTPNTPKARLLHGAPQRPAGPVADPLAWLSVDHETVTLPDMETGEEPLTLKPRPPTLDQLGEEAD